MAGVTGATEANTHNALFSSLQLHNKCSYTPTHTYIYIFFIRVIFAKLLLFLKQFGVEALSKLLAHLPEKTISYSFQMLYFKVNTCLIKNHNDNDWSWQ